MNSDLTGGVVKPYWAYPSFFVIRDRDNSYVWSAGRKMWVSMILNEEKVIDCLFSTEGDAQAYLDKHKPKVMLSSLKPGTKFKFKSSPTGCTYIKSAKEEYSDRFKQVVYTVIREDDWGVGDNPDTEVIVMT